MHFWDAKFEPRKFFTEEDEFKEDLAPPLWRRVNEKLGYCFTTTHKKNPKSKHQTMVFSGRADIDDPQSTIVFYRSCIGDVGNILDKMREIRDLKNRDLFLQCDHSPANHPSKTGRVNKFLFTIARCLAHCRRPFKRRYNQDPKKCEELLSMMFLITHFEKQINDHGKNEINTVKIRRC